MKEEITKNIDSELTFIFKEQNQIQKVASNPLTKAIIGTIPFGGGVASLLGDNAQKRQELRLRRFLTQLANDIESNQYKIIGKVDKNYLKSDDFCAVVETLLQEASRTADQTKLEYLKAFLISSTLIDRPDVTWKELYLNYIKQLSGFHLSILAVIYRIQGELPSSDRLRGVEILDKVPLSTTKIKEMLVTEDNLLVEISCVDLLNLGLIVDWKYLRSENSNIQENYCLSDSGLKFFQFLLLDKKKEI